MVPRTGKHRKAAPPASECKVSVWEERDRLHIHLYHGDENTTVAEWWDDDARSMFEDGFFKSGRDLTQSVIEYAQSHGLVRPE
jgi:hypothetical protein